MRRISEALPNVPVVIFSTIETRDHALKAISLGAQGFISKSANRVEIVQGLRVVLDGSVYLSKRTLKGPPSPEPADSDFSHVEGLAALTNRQREALALLAQGKANKEIAEELGISQKTVRFYISAILKALKVRNRTKAALIASRVM